MLLLILSACEADRSTAPQPPQIPPGHLRASVEAAYGFVTCERYGQPQSQATCQQMKQLDDSIRLAALEEATRLQNSFGFGEECHQIGIEIQRVVSNDLAYQVPYAFVGDGGLKADGDFHRDAGLPDQVHIAAGWDEINPARGLPWIVESFRHEAAHAIGRHHPDSYRLAQDCGPNAGGGGGDPGDGPLQPYSAGGTVAW